MRLGLVVFFKKFVSAAVQSSCCLCAFLLCDITCIIIIIDLIPIVSLIVS